MELHLFDVLTLSEAFYEEGSHIRYESHKPDC